MALTGAWKNAQATQAGALKWGTGINPVHSIRAGEGRDIATHGSDNLVPSNLTVDEWLDYGFADYESALETPEENGTADRPPLGMDTQRFRNHAGNFPSWGTHAQGLPGGAGIRSEDHGASLGTQANVLPDEDVAQGWLNKATGDVDTSTEPAVAQLLRQTSDQQLRRTRAGSQRGSGSASEYEQPIATRVPGQKILSFSTGQRLYDMQPREQTPRIRGWWNRKAGTGYPQWMEANAQRQVSPRTREIPPEPSTGPPAIASDGYTSEDVLPYV